LLNKLQKVFLKKTPFMSPITTHILDTATGKPAANIPLKLEKKVGEEWHILAQGITNQDGRVSNLLSSENPLEFGIYKMVFDTEGYFKKEGIDTFYPFVEITFYVNDTRHYHIPLLLSPFGFTTYRGS
jgi:5-hydroxyisourate hydrolase